MAEIESCCLIDFNSFRDIEIVQIELGLNDIEWVRVEAHWQ
jgi:hypothetical protein